MTCGVWRKMSQAHSAVETMPAMLMASASTRSVRGWRTAPDSGIVTIRKDQGRCRAVRSSLPRRTPRSRRRTTIFSTSRPEKSS